MRLHLEKLNGWVNPSDAFIALHRKDEFAFWLDRSTNKSESLSVIGSAGSIIRAGDEALQLVRQELADWQGLECDSDIPFSFRPGLVGYLGYELGSSQREGNHPKAQFMKVDRAMVFDHQNRQMYFIGVFEAKADFDTWYQAALLRLALIGGELAAFKVNTPRAEIFSIRPRHSDQEYLELIARAREHIAKGDAYQICLTNQIAIELKASALRTFLDLRESSPAPYSSYLKLGGLEIVSTSPEQFLKVTPEGLVSTKPIKGTRPRSQDALQDQKLATELRENEKERAENLMIVDLMRNDLGRVCEPESVVVESLFSVESYATVHQLVSEVIGKLKSAESAVSAIAATFPAGSMTGAPKIRAMEILESLESGPRDIYSGAIGYLGQDGSVDLGMTIRTLVFEGDWATLGVGGGITIDSDPLSELEETKLKARALIDALGGAKWKI
ncbi:MAG: aminodeoxychorismate synthase component I [Actinomycetota bacterium]